MSLRVCPVVGCPNLTTGGRCAECKAKAERQRGTSTQRGYGKQHQGRFRAGVLRRDPLCVCQETKHNHAAPCDAPSHHADHDPRGRDELVRLGLDPNDPQYGRGLCTSCHSKVTAVKQPGGWNSHAR